MSSNLSNFEYTRVLSIAGSDSSGGAGVQADLKTIAALGCYGMTAITALTAQNTVGVRAIHGVPPAMLRDQIDAVVEDLGVHAVKIGMLHSPDIVRTVAKAIDRHALKSVVLDPVMVATSGAVLINDPAIAVLVSELFRRRENVACGSGNNSLDWYVEGRGAGVYSVAILYNVETWIGRDSRNRKGLRTVGCADNNTRGYEGRNRGGEAGQGDDPAGGDCREPG